MCVAVCGRARVEKADRVLYVTDAGQSSHFDQVFQVVRKAQFIPPTVELKYVLVDRAESMCW